MHSHNQYINILDLIEHESMEACIKVAVDIGLTREQAETCDDCEHKCPDCPFHEANT